MITATEPCTMASVEFTVSCEDGKPLPVSPTGLDRAGIQLFVTSGKDDIERVYFESLLCRLQRKIRVKGRSRVLTAHCDPGFALFPDDRLTIRLDWPDKPDMIAVETRVVLGARLK